MAANFGRFIDRSPNISAAGKPTSNFEEDHMKTILDEGSERNKKIETKYVLELQEAEDEVDTDELQERTDAQNEAETNSLAGHKDSVTELMHTPPKPYEVLWDGHHDPYETTYDDYNAPEEAKGFSIPIYIEQVLSKSAHKGVWIKCVCDGLYEEERDHSSQIEADYLERYKSQLGKQLSPNHNVDSVPEGFSFGKHSKHTSYGMNELLKDASCPPCIFRKDCYKWMATLNKLRNTMNHRVNEMDFHFNSFNAKCADRDSEKTGFLKLDEFYELCGSEYIHFHKEDIEPLLKLVHIIEGDKIHYQRFLEIIDINKPTIKIIPIHDVPIKNQYYETSNEATMHHYLITHDAEMPTAGLPSTHDDEPRVATTEGSGHK